MGQDAADSSGERHDRRSMAGFDHVADWTDVCVDLFHADGGAVVVASARNPDLRTVLHTTDTAAARVADLLYVLGDGPHADAMADGAPHNVVVDDPADALQWPLLVNELAARQVRWVQVFPLGPGSAPVGTLQLVGSTATGQPLPGDAEVFVATLARLIGTDALAWAAAAYLEDRTDGDVIHMAIGVLRVRHALTADAASALLRADAYAAGRTATEQARLVVDSAGGTVTDPTPG
jgi:hypothetical protein